MKNQLLIGAHTSAQGGAFRALLEGESIGASTVQLFTANQKQWKSKPLTEEAIDDFVHAQQKTGLQKIMSHAGYLINLGCPNAENLEKSRRAFREEIERCLSLGITYLNFHPGAALNDSPEHCLERIIESLLLCQDLLIDDALRLLIETTAGQGSCVGYCFEQLATLLKGTASYLPMGICIDTCHIFAAGYDIRTTTAWNETLEAFDQIVGLKHLYAFHLNDSLHPLGSRKDRHAPLGEGEIGMDAFRFLVTDRRTRHLPMYLETPGGPMQWDKEIGLLKTFAQEAR